MDFTEIQRQSAVAARKEEVIQATKGGMLEIRLVYGSNDGIEGIYTVEHTSCLHRKIKELIAEELEKENKQTASNLRNWTR